MNKLIYIDIKIIIYNEIFEILIYEKIVNIIHKFQEYKKYHYN